MPGEVFEFAVMMGDHPVNTWRSEFRATDEGDTDVTESFDLGDNVLSRSDMLRALERVKAVAEDSE